MLSKIGGLSRAVAILLAVVSAIVAIPGLDTANLLVVLGLLAGLAYSQDDRVGLILAALVLPLVSAVLSPLPAVGGQLGAIAGNLAVVAAASVATVLALRLVAVVKGDVSGLTGK